MVRLKILLVALVCTSLAVNSCFSAEPQEIKVGIIAPLTLGSASAGREVSRVADLFAEEHATSAKYRFIIEDGKCGIGNGAASAAQKLIHQDKVAALIVGCSGEVLQAGPIAERAHIPTFAVFASHKDIKHMGAYIYRTFVDMEGGVKIISQAMIDDARSRIVILSENNPFTQGLKGLLEPSLDERIVFSDDFEANESDFRTLLTKAKAKLPDALYLNCASAKTLLSLVKQLREQAITVPIYSYLYPGEREILESAGERAEGIKFLALPDPDPNNEVVRAFLEKYVVKYHESPNYMFLIAAAEDALSALNAAFLAVGTESDRVRLYLDSYHGSGALGPIEFDENGDLRNVRFVLKHILDGRPLLLQQQ